MSKHTAGPWHHFDTPTCREIFGGCSVIVADGIDDAVIASIGEDVQGHEANAHLIAAAPELLEALKVLAEKFPILLSALGNPPETVAANLYVKNALAAIAKAEAQ